MQGNIYKKGNIIVDDGFIDFVMRNSQRGDSRYDSIAMEGFFVGERYSQTAKNPGDKIYTNVFCEEDDEHV